MAKKVAVSAEEYAAFMKRLDDWGKTLPARERVILKALVASATAPDAIELSDQQLDAVAGGTWGRLPDGTLGRLADGTWGRLPDGTTWGRLSDGTTWGRLSDGTWGRIPDGAWLRASDGGWGRI